MLRREVRIAHNSHMLSRLMLAVLAPGFCLAQAPVGGIAGIVTDPSGAAVAKVHVVIKSLATGFERTRRTPEDGSYSVAALPAGIYEVTAQAEAFRSMTARATVEVGATTTLNLTMQVGSVSEVIDVADATPQMKYEQYQVSGVVTRDQILNLPLNGRNFLDLAKLEPGVTNPVPNSNNRVVVPVLGVGSITAPAVGYTQVTVDGGSTLQLNFPGASLKVSQEAVQEFQISTINFDPATSFTASGAINIVTRSGGNNFHGGGFLFLRDHNLAAYPALARDATNLDPFFQRRQFGYSLGGPIHKDRPFFFTNFERNDQRGVVSIQPGTSEFAFARGIFPSPTFGALFSTRIDARLNRNHDAFARYTHDGNHAIAPVASQLGYILLPSNWSRVTNWYDQSLTGLTSVIGTAMVNELRFSYVFGSSPQAPLQPGDCPQCLGLGPARIRIPDAGIVLGNPTTLSFLGRRYQLTEGLTWQKRTHRVRFGFDWEHTGASSSTLDFTPAELTLYSPRQARQVNLPLPASFSTLDDILRLPLMSFQTNIGPTITPGPGFRKDRITEFYRFYVADSWRVDSRLTVNWGLAWSFEPNSLDYDLTKPALLLPLVGAGGLNPPQASGRNFSPTLGFAWTATRDGKTVLRGGAGRYFDSVLSNAGSGLAERPLLLPYGTGRNTIMGSSVVWNGRPLDFPSQPTSFTGANLLADIGAIRASLERGLNPNNRDFSVRNIDVSKSGSDLYDPFYQPSYALHFNLGVQRQIARDLVVNADLVWRHYVHTPINNVDYNRYNSAQGPVIPRCTTAQSTDPRVACSNGSIGFDNSAGLTRYRGLLVRVEKRFAHHVQFLGSYALASNVGSNALRASSAVASGFNNNNWFENYGPMNTDQRHVLNVSGFVKLPRGFQLSTSITYYSQPPFAVFVSGIDFNGDGTRNDLLPGTKENQFNRGLGKDDLARLVDQFNQQFAGKRTTGGQVAPRLTLPASYSFDHNFFTQDLRLSRTFFLGTERLRLTLLGEVFNLFNYANLMGYSGNIANAATFGQPSAATTR
jgi:hypothetical protein